MNELQRMQYLEELGIAVYVPRFILPAAKLSVQALLPETAVVPAPPPNDIATKAVGRTSLESNLHGSTVNVGGIVSNIMGELGIGAEQPKKVIEESAPVVAGVLAGGAIPKQESVSFFLSLWRVNKSLLVIDTHYPKQALPTATLLSNILFAKGISQRLPTPEVIQWPMFSHVQSRAGWGDAGDMVKAFLQARLNSQPVEYVWLMGDSAFKSVLHQQGCERKVGAAIDLADFSALAIVLPSLTELLLNPQLKREAWNSIRPYSFE